jgi:hypothetical protein
MGTKQRSIRLPSDLWDWLDSLPPDYGTDLTERVKCVLYRGKRVVEREMGIADDIAAEITGQSKHSATG